MMIRPDLRPSPLTRVSVIRWCLRAAAAAILAAMPAVASAQLADVSITVGDSPDPVTSGGHVVYTITVTNSGPDLATDVQVDFPLTASTTLVSFTTASGWSATAPPGGPFQFTRASVPVGSSIFSVTVAVNPSLGATVLNNAATVTTTADDPNGGNDTGNVSTNVVSPTPIHDIQGPGASSPIVGATVTTRGVVTGVAPDGFFIQEDDATVDADPNTSEGLFVFTSGPSPAEAARTSRVQVTGTVAEFIPSSDPQQPPRTQLAMSAILQLAPAGQPLPTAIPLTPTFPDPAGPFDQLERVEHMRVSAASITVTGPSGNVDELNGTGTTDGRFYGAVTGVARPFREAGIQAPDTVPTGTIPPIPRWDVNPERLRIESLTLTRPIMQSLTPNSSDVIGPIIGVLDYSSRAYAILLDGAATAAVTEGTLQTTVTAPASDEVTVASFNLRRFFDTTDDPNTSDTIVAPGAYGLRLSKASVAIRTHMGAPDIIGVQDAETLAVLQDLANAILVDGGPAYDAYLVEGNDANGLDVGFLVKTEPVDGGVPRVAVNSVLQMGAAATWLDPTNDTEALLFDHPPLVLDALVNGSSADAFPIIVIGTHLTSRTGIDSEDVDGLTTVGDRVRRKRQAQAEFLANAVQERQTLNPGDRIAVVGDFNAFEMNDGYVDMMNMIAGTPTPDNETVVPGDGVDLVDPDLLNLVNTPVGAERYSYVEAGHAQNLDHVLVSTSLVGATAARRIEHARIGADYPETERNNTTALRVSDHDPVVAYFKMFGPSPDLAVVITDSMELAFPDQDVTYTITVANSGSNAATSVSLTDTLPGTMTFVSLESPVDWSCTTPAIGAGGTVACTIASFAPGSVVFTLTMHIPASEALGTAFTNFVTVASPDDVTEENNQAATTTTVNDAPTISDLSDQTVAEDSAGIVEPFTFSDMVPGTVTISATSSNQALVPDGHITFQELGFFNRAVVVAPAANQHGSTVITVTVNDGGATVSDTFTLNVTPVNDAPTIGAIPSQSINANTVAGPLAFTVADIDDAATDLTVSATSSNQALVTDAGIALGGSGSNRVVTITPLADAHGQTTIILTVNDGEASTSTEFVVQVAQAADQAPTLEGLVDVAMDESATHTLTLTIDDDATEPSALVVTATSSNQTLLPNASLVLGGSGAARTLTFSPTAEQSGGATVTVTVSDGALTTTRTAIVTVAVASVPQPPTELNATVLGNAVTLNWLEPTAGSAPRFYVIGGGIAPGLTTLPVIDTPTRVTSWTQTLPAGIYFFRVRSANRVGTSIPSNEVRVVVTSPVAIAGPPTGFAMDIEGLRARASWNRPASGAATIWQIELGSMVGASDRGVFALPSGITTGSGVLAPGEYAARIRGLNAAGAGQASNEVRFRVGDVPACDPLRAPVLLPATVRDRVVTLGWRLPVDTGVSTYRLLIGSVPGAGDLAIVDLPAATAFVATAPPGSYHVTVLATNACGAIAASNPIVVDVAAIDPPANMRAAVIGPNRVGLAWSAVTGARSYVLEAGFAPGRRDLSFATAATGIVFNDVPAGTYHVRVRAVGVRGETSAPSGEIVVTVP
jgi:uncharacterized repeat protein (TIGR01451 family)